MRPPLADSRVLDVMSPHFHLQRELEIETVVNIVLFPYTLVAEAFGTGEKLWLLDTAMTWVIGTTLYTLIFLIAGAGAHSACLGIEAGAEKLRAAADRGANLEERRRNANWLVRVSARMSTIRARGPITIGGVLNDDAADPPHKSNRSNWLARRVIHLLEFLHEFRVLVPGILFTTGGGLGLIGAS
jgi:hypothetical protein